MVLTSLGLLNQRSANKGSLTNLLYLTNDIIL